MDKKIKWCAIQPLTGGMYIGAQNAIGHKAEFILSFPGIGDPTIDKKTGEVIGGGNEYHLMKYLESKNDLPEYKVFNRSMFQDDHDMSPEIISSCWTQNPNKELDYSDMHLCIAVPVCSGLSMATRCSDDTCKSKNCNMLWITEYALKVIKPNIYIFENAPTFLSKKAEYLRHEMETLANENGYSVVYYKTDTIFHDNCQSRKRTFIIFYKKEYAPSMDYEHITTSLESYFARIPENASQNDPFRFNSLNCLNEPIINYFHENINQIITKYNLKQIDDKEYNNSNLIWRNYISNIVNFVVSNYDKFIPELIDYFNSLNLDKKEKIKCINILEHIYNKLSLGKNFFYGFPHKPINKIPAIMYKTIQCCLHPYKNDHLLSCRECLHLMGMPHDYELQGNVNKEYAKIGQNVPVRTAYWIISNSLESFKKDNDLDEIKKCRIFDNIKQREITKL